METVKTQERSDDKYEIRDQKLKLINLVCAALIHEPNFYSSADTNKSTIGVAAGQVAKVDPEFLLKLALYVRDDLNIRSTANFLLCHAAQHKECHPFFKDYFNACVRLPSDLLEIVTMYLHMNQSPNAEEGSDPLRGTLPSVLRKASQKKFLEFDEYQLAKYNREKSQKKKEKAKKAKIVNARPGKEPQTSSKPKMITLKQLIRKVHISEPVSSVMAIVGKKYPATEEEFRKSKLPGNWDSTQAGKRMKLPVPETWETLLSKEGNKHTTWETLLGHKKLPFMAMLRNLRNMIVTGISPDFHEEVLNRLTDERSVTSSRQLPWRFLSAYESINVDLEKMMNDILDNDGSSEKIIQVKVKGKKGAKMSTMRTIKKKVIIPVYMPDLPLIERYRSSIDTAVRISTMHNLVPIEGNTVVFCDVSGSMKCPCSTRGNMGSTIQTVMDVAILLGLMLQDCCERCDFRIFSSPPGVGKRCDISVELQQNSILENVKRVHDSATRLGGGTDFPYGYLEDLILKKERIDTFVILSDMMIAPGHNDMSIRENSVSKILKEYRDKVNPNLLFVTIDLYGSGRSIVDVSNPNPLDVLITGFSDNILRFIAEKGGHKQLEAIETIKERKKLGEKKKSKK